MMSLPRFIELLIAVIALIVGGGVGVGALSPPTDDTALNRFLHVALTAGVWVLAWLASRKWNRKLSSSRVYRRFLNLTFASLAIIIVSLVPRLILRNAWTVSYVTQRVLIGGELTVPGQAYFKALPDATDWQALLDSAGKPEEVWTSDSIRRRAWILWPLHIMGFGSSIFMIIFAWYVLRQDLSKVASVEASHESQSS